MRRMKTGQKPLRLLILSTIMAVMLSGCGDSGYEAVDLTETTSAVTAAEPATVSIGAIATDPEHAEEGNGAERDDAEAGPTDEARYQETNDRIIVTADLLNVRKTDSTDAGIYVQLPRGEILERTGFNETWCRVIYDGEVAYVAADMVELYEEPETSEDAESSKDAETSKDAESSENPGISGPPASETAENMESSFENSLEAGADVKMAGELDVNGLAAYSEEDEMVQAPPNGHVVAIDAGHQAKANAEKEPIGPNSKTMKAKMPEGAVGTATGVEEYELTLNVAQKLEEKLRQQGYEVVMIRSGHDVNLSNAERSEIANESDAEIFIRLHANSMENSSVYGALAMCMTEYNPYNAELHSQSYTLSKKIIDHICALTGTKNRGVQTVDNSSAINWCEIPVSVVEMGFLSNPDEDRWLQDEDYQAKIVTGITEAIDSYFAEGN